MSIRDQWRYFWEPRKEYALLYNDDGTLARRVRFHLTDQTFTVTINDVPGSYTIIRTRGVRHTIKKWLGKDTTHYLYRMGDPLPIAFKVGVPTPVIAPEVLKQLLDNSVLKALNTPPSDGLLGKIGIKEIVVFIIILVIVWYFISNPGALQ
jgi:hypothetical protein